MKGLAVSEELLQAEVAAHREIRKESKNEEP
jgi:hypothetical protein